MEQRPAQWQRQWQPRWMPLTNGACVASSKSITVSTCPTQKWGVAHVCPPLSETIRSRRLGLFGHIAHAGPEMDHCWAFHAPINNPPRDWKRQRGRLAHTWTCTDEADLKSCNIGLHSAWHRAQDRNAWSRLVQTAMGSALDDDEGYMIIASLVMNRVILSSIHLGSTCQTQLD